METRYRRLILGVGDADFINRRRCETERRRLHTHCLKRMCIHMSKRMCTLDVIWSGDVYTYAYAHVDAYGYAHVYELDAM